jgi:hypothetical protein
MGCGVVAESANRDLGLYNPDIAGSDRSGANDLATGRSARGPASLAGTH